jgi:hypothetical protein
MLVARGGETPTLRDTFKKLNPSLINQRRVFSLLKIDVTHSA